MNGNMRVTYYIALVSNDGGQWPLRRRDGEFIWSAQRGFGDVKS